MKSLVKQMSIYHQYHQKMGTKVTHFIGIPLAILPVLMLLNWFSFSVNAVTTFPMSWLAIAALMIYYVLLDWQLMLLSLVAFIILNWIAVLISGHIITWHGVLSLIIVFIVAWIIQFAGHILFEKKRPALLDNFFQVLIAPIFIVAEVLFLFGLRQDLKKAVLETVKPASEQKSH